MVEKKIIKLFSQDRSLWEKYNRYLDLTFVKNNYTILYKIFLLINNTYNNKTINNIDIESNYLASYPVLKEADRQELNLVIKDIESQEVEVDTIVEVLEAHKVRGIASSMALVALDVSEGRRSPEELVELATKLSEGSPIEEAGSDEFEVLSTDIEILAEDEETEEGLHWRLTGLNKSLGPIRKGNMGHIFAARETGKTAMWVSESMYMASQLKDGQTLDVFFNEEEGKSIIWRMYNCVLKWDYQQILANPKKAKTLFYDAIGGERIRFFDRASLDKKFIERAVEKGNPGLIIIDNMDKVKGWVADRKDQMLHQAYIWARELAKQVCPVLTIGQADATSFNQMWISDAQMAEGKVGKPGETDFTIGIGRTDMSQHEYERYIFISRNKLRGDKNTLEGLRHAKFTAILQPQYSLYVDGGTHAIL